MERELQNRLRNTVVQCRRLLETAALESLQGRFGIHPSGRIEDEARMRHLSEEERTDRRELVDHLQHLQASGLGPAEAVERLTREVAFTHLNRLVAFKMMEDPSRRIIRETVRRGTRSNGFQFYLADHPEDERRAQAGEEDVAYRRYLLWVGERLSQEIGPLFSPNDAANRLFPPHRVLEQVLSLLNADDLSRVWAEDETIGWVYQYFTPKELRDRARGESQAPRNSYELAFRNQFYTPRYVVRFLVDNTLGRIWYEMRRGDSRLATECTLMLPPAMLPDRRRKDPRDIRVLDPACGSGHFLLYAFDLLQMIYREAWEDPSCPPSQVTGRTLRADYPDRERFEREIPGLILRYNLHGIDIDLRAVQIAVLALWLRAQRAFQELGLRRDDRPVISRANIVCAEPMPGEADLLEEFTASLEPRVLGQLVRVVFHRMEKADEVGSLLRIEEEIRETVDEARLQWEKWRKNPQLTLPLFPPGPEQLTFDVSEVTSESFWQVAEERVLTALREYANRAANGRGFTRRLFAEDAARGFAFVDVCRKEFDVVLMNPPFGEVPGMVKAYMEKHFPRSKQDVACAFVDRWLARCAPGGKLGAITTRTPLFLSSSTRWREEVILQEGALDVLADLGYGVLEAMVETAAYVLNRGGPGGQATFFRLVKDEDKEAALRQVLADPADGRRFAVVPEAFRQVPNSPLAYWVSDRIRRLFKELPPFESEGRTVKQGLATADDFRFVRAWWEVPPETIVTGTGSETREDFIRQTYEGKRWVPFAKGGSYSPYYADLHLVVNWERDGEEIKGFIDPATGRLKSRPQNTEYYFRPGLTWPRRTDRLSFRILPIGAIFADKGSAAFVEGDAERDLSSLLGIVNSKVFHQLVSVQLGRIKLAKSFEVGLIQKTPMPSIPHAQLATDALACYHLARELSSIDETDHNFVLPAMLYCGTEETLSATLKKYSIWNEMSREELQIKTSQVEEEVCRIYGITRSELDELGNVPPGEATGIKHSEEGGFPSFLSDTDNQEEDDEDSDTLDVVKHENIVADLISWCVGVTVGRFDIRLATGERVVPPPGPPFSPLPGRSPGMLPAGEVPSGYPIEVPAEGILVEDELNSSRDIVERARHVLELIWGNRSEMLEREMVDKLGARSLREYFRNPRGFFEYHTKRYSRSKRKAPIYWLLQSPRRSYSLWLYYHRLDQDTLFKALTLYVEPKIRLEEERLDTLRQSRQQVETTGPEGRHLAREIERQEAVVADLHEFRDRLKRVADLHLVPDLHDGVILNMAPLWELVPWKEPKKYWDELLQGKYEWSSIARQLRDRGLVRGGGR